MIGGFRVIGGSRELFEEGYCEGLKRCKENLDEQKIVELANDQYIKVCQLMKDDYGSEESQIESAKWSAFDDVLMDLRSLVAFMGEELGKKVVINRIDSTLERWGD